MIRVNAPFFGEEECRRVTEVMRTGWVGDGPEVGQFQKALAGFWKVPFVVGTASCTAAMEIALLACGVGRDHEVITSAFTFVATLNAIIATGAKPVLVDVDPNTFNLDLNQVEARIGPRTRAIIPVHHGGLPVNQDHLETLRRKYQVRIVQDCAHAFESQWRGISLANFGDAACYSFSPGKSIGTIGGGAIATGDPDLAERASRMVFQGLSRTAWNVFSSAGKGMPATYDSVDVGRRESLSAVSAGLGLVQLPYVAKRYERRRALGERYRRAFATLPFYFQASDCSGLSQNAFHLFSPVLTSTIPGRAHWIGELANRGVGTAIHYPAIPRLTYFRRLLNLNPDDFPVTGHLGENIFSLPFSAHLSDHEVEKIISAVLATSIFP